MDKKAEVSFLQAVMSITSCFDNVFMVSRPMDVVYAAWPRVQADINCMADLYNASTSWKYLMNLCGQDFPLKTNLEMVRSLKTLKGANSMETEQMVDGKRWRVKSAHRIVNGELQVVIFCRPPSQCLGVQRFVDDVTLNEHLQPRPIMLLHLMYRL